MGLQLILCLESHVAFALTDVVRADEMRSSEMDFKALIVVVEHVAVGFATQVTRQVHSVQVLLEL